METTSVLVSNRTIVPSSVQPEATPLPASVPQTIFPSASVSRVDPALQFNTVSKRMPPPVIRNPERVEEAEVFNRVAEIPPPKVEVAVEVDCSNEADRRP